MSKCKYRSFSEDELKSDYYEFERIKENLKDELHISCLKWIKEWEDFDLFMKYGKDGDLERSYVRFGHFMGFMRNYDGDE